MFLPSTLTLLWAGLRVLHGLLGPGPAGPTGSSPLRKRTAPRPGDVPPARGPCHLARAPGPAGKGRGLYHQAGGPGPGGFGFDPPFSSTPRTNLVTARRVTCPLRHVTRPRPGPRGPGPGTLPPSWRAGARRLRFRPVLLVVASDQPGHCSTRHVTPTPRDPPALQAPWARAGDSTTKLLPAIPYLAVRCFSELGYSRCTAGLDPRAGLTAHCRARLP